MKILSRRAFLAGVGASLLAYTGYNLYSIAVTRYAVGIRNLPRVFQGFTFLHLTDLHSKTYGRGQAGLLEMIGGCRFDAVAITGDLIDKRHPHPRPALDLVEGLPSGKPVYFVPGNHEWASGYSFHEPLRARGVRVLENRAERLEKEGAHLWIVGVDDPHTGRDRLPQAMEDVSGGGPRLLLAHAPNIFSKAVQAGIDLALVGHTHGGQVRLPLVGAVVVPGQKLFPEYDYGLYTRAGTTMIINKGLGESGLPVRFNCRPEVVLVTLQAAA